MAEEYSIVYLYRNFCIHSSVDGHLGCFHVPAVVNSAAMNSGIHVSLSVLVSSGYMIRSGVAGSYGGLLIFIDELSEVFQNTFKVQVPYQMHDLQILPSNLYFGHLMRGG